MNCYQHPDTPATAFCRSCGKPLCAACQFPTQGTVFCAEHAPQTPSAAAAAQPAAGAGAGAGAPPYAAPNPYTAPADPYTATAAPGLAPAATGLQTSPGLAFLLGLIPGVGAIYNGQYAKGLAHAVVFGLLISLADAAQGTPGQPALVMCCIAFFCYMPIEAFHTAKKKQLGLQVDEWSGLLSARPGGSPIPVGPIIVILIGVLFLLHSLHVLSFHFLVRFWPVILIVAGVVMLVARLRTSAGREAPAPDVLEPSREH